MIASVQIKWRPGQCLTVCVWVISKFPRQHAPADGDGLAWEKSLLAPLQQRSFSASQKYRTPKGYFQERKGRSRKSCWRLHWQKHNNYWLPEARLRETWALSVSKAPEGRSRGTQKTLSLWLTWPLSSCVSVSDAFLEELLFLMLLSFLFMLWRWKMNCIFII